MKPLQLLFQSTIGKKFLMGATGAALVLFVLGHLAGNLQVFLPKEHINAYAHFLHENAGLIWGARIGLLAMVGVHVWAAITLSALNKAARPEAYRSGHEAYSASWTSRHMLLTGLVIAAFAVYHLLHYTLQVGAINLTGQDFGGFIVEAGPQKGFKDVHRMLVVGFSHPVVVLFYVVAIALLCLHLSHGMAAMFQSLGLREGAWKERLQTGALALAALIFAGYASIPLAVFLRIVQ